MKQNRHPIFNLLYKRQWPSAQEQNQGSPPCDLQVALELQNGQITKKGLKCLHVEQKMEPGEAVTAGNNGRKDGVIIVFQRPSQRASKPLAG